MHPPKFRLCSIHRLLHGRRDAPPALHLPLHNGLRLFQFFHGNFDSFFPSRQHSFFYIFNFLQPVLLLLLIGHARRGRRPAPFNHFDSVADVDGGPFAEAERDLPLLPPQLITDFLHFCRQFPGEEFINCGGDGRGGRPLRTRHRLPHRLLRLLRGLHKLAPRLLPRRLMRRRLGPRLGGRLLRPHLGHALRALLSAAGGEGRAARAAWAIAGCTGAGAVTTAASSTTAATATASSSTSIGIGGRGGGRGGGALPRGQRAALRAAHARLDHGRGGAALHAWLLRHELGAVARRRRAGTAARRRRAGTAADGARAKASIDVVAALRHKPRPVRRDRRNRSDRSKRPHPHLRPRYPALLAFVVAVLLLSACLFTAGMDRLPGIGGAVAAPSVVLRHLPPPWTTFTGLSASIVRRLFRPPYDADNAFGRTLAMVIVAFGRSRPVVPLLFISTALPPPLLPLFIVGATIHHIGIAFHGLFAGRAST